MNKRKERAAEEEREEEDVATASVSIQERKLEETATASALDGDFIVKRTMNDLGGAIMRCMLNAQETARWAGRADELMQRRAQPDELERAVLRAALAAKRTKKWSERANQLCMEEEEKQRSMHTTLPGLREEEKQ